MGLSKIPFWGTLLLTLPLVVLLSSCTPFGERKFSNHLVVKEEYGLPLEVESTKILQTEGERAIVLRLENKSKKDLLLVCRVYLLSEDGTKISVPGFETQLCRIPAKGEAVENLVLPLVGFERQTFVVEILKMKR